MGSAAGLPAAVTSTTPSAATAAAANAPSRFATPLPRCRRGEPGAATAAVGGMGRAIVLRSFAPEGVGGGGGREGSASPLALEVRGLAVVRSEHAAPLAWERSQIGQDWTVARLID
ncbi:hypothetical protein ADK67_09265 [Saccharothrix sp. NRRL B-16348]|nr:hypothetical protein ADK67_09265 [Saccharothrix sp. NRRL B-16348]